MLEESEPRATLGHELVKVFAVKALRLHVAQPLARAAPPFHERHRRHLLEGKIGRHAIGQRHPRANKAKGGTAQVQHRQALSPDLAVLLVLLPDPFVLRCFLCLVRASAYLLRKPQRSLKLVL